MKSRCWQMCWLPGQAGRAGAVPAQRHDGDRVAGRPALDARAERGDRGRTSRARDGGRGDPGVHVAVEDVQVGAADADVGDGDVDLPGPGLGRFGLADGDRAGAPVHSLEHGSLSLCVDCGSREGRSVDDAPVRPAAAAPAVQVDAQYADR